MPGTRALGDDLLAALELAAGDDAVRAVTITGAGRAFSSGADLQAGFATTPTGEPDVGTLLRERYNPIIAAVRDLPKPVLAAVNGPAVGIGCSLALACDLVVARESAYLLLAFVNIGLVPDGGATLLVPARAGMARAAEMALLGERIPARRALEWGLVTRVTADEAFEAEVDALAERLATGPTRAYAGTKRALNAALFAGTRRAARARGVPPAGAGRLARLRGGRARLHREARRQVRRGVSDPARPMNTLRSPMGPSRPLFVLRRALPAAILILLVTAATASAGILAPESGAGEGGRNEETAFHESHGRERVRQRRPEQDHGVLAARDRHFGKVPGDIHHTAPLDATRTLRRAKCGDVPCVSRGSPPCESRLRPRARARWRRGCERRPREHSWPLRTLRPCRSSAACRAAARRGVARLAPRARRAAHPRVASRATARR